MHSLEEDRVDIGDSGRNLCYKSIQHVTYGDAPCGSSAASVYAVMEKRFQTPKEDLHYRYQLQSKPRVTRHICGGVCRNVVFVQTEADIRVQRRTGSLDSWKSLIDIEIICSEHKVVFVN